LSRHGNDKIHPFLWRLLPDDELVLGQWAGEVSVISPRLLQPHLGGRRRLRPAVQFVRPERLDAFLGQHPPEIEWLDEADIAKRLRTLREDQSAWRIPRDTGQFSLAGRAAEDRAFISGWKMGRSFRQSSNDPHPQASHCGLRRPRRKRALFPQISSRLGPPRRRFQDHAFMHFQNEIAIAVDVRPVAALSEQIFSMMH
jgi:serine/threonine-protein kinase HipA